MPAIAGSFPECVHFGWRTLADYTAEERERIMPLLKNMVGLMALATNVFLGYDIHHHLELARSSRIAVPSPQFLISLLVSNGVIIWHRAGDNFISTAILDRQLGAAP